MYIISCLPSSWTQTPPYRVRHITLTALGLKQCKVYSQKCWSWRIRKTAHLYSAEAPKKVQHFPAKNLSENTCLLSTAAEAQWGKDSRWPGGWPGGTGAAAAVRRQSTCWKKMPSNKEKRRWWFRLYIHIWLYFWEWIVFRTRWKDGASLHRSDFFFWFCCSLSRLGCWSQKFYQRRCDPCLLAFVLRFASFYDATETYMCSSSVWSLKRHGGVWKMRFKSNSESSKAFLSVDGKRSTTLSTLGELMISFLLDRINGLLQKVEERISRAGKYTWVCSSVPIVLSDIAQLKKKYVNQKSTCLGGNPLRINKYRDWHFTLSVTVPALGSCLRYSSLMQGRESAWSWYFGFPDFFNAVGWERCMRVKYSNHADMT